MSNPAETPELRELLTDALIKQHAVWEIVEEIALLTDADFVEVDEWVAETARAHAGLAESDTRLLAARFVADFRLDEQHDGQP